MQFKIFVLIWELYYQVIICTFMIDSSCGAEAKYVINHSCKIMYNKGLFSHWVPKPLMLFLIIIMLLPILALNGVYTSTASDISGALATYAEYIILANNATAIGMSISILICIRIKSRFRSKEIIAGSCILLSILCYIIATTDDPMVLIWGSFMIGFVKVFPMVELIMPIMFMIAPNVDRGKFYAIFYPCSIAIGQLSSYVMSTFILNATWQAPYFIMAIITILVASDSILFQHNQRFCFKTPLYQIDWVTLFLLSICGMSFNYFFTFMKQQDWFESDCITLAGVLGVAFFLLTIHRQKVIKRPLITSIYSSNCQIYDMQLFSFYFLESICPQQVYTPNMLVVYWAT